MIAYQGQQGAYSHLACTHVFPDRTSVACETFVDAMAMAETGKAELAMIPVENSTAGRVEEIYRLIPAMKLHIIGEHFEPINHCLMAMPGTQLSDLKTVRSHPQALAQCASNIASLKLRTEATFDTAGSAYLVGQSKDKSYAAIASSLAADLYNLEILDPAFQDIQGNTTRFIILSGTKPALQKEAGKSYITSVLFKVRNMPSALYKTLGGFATNGLNLAKLESYMPDGTMNATQFHIDIEAHPEDRAYQFAMEELNFFAREVRILGTYEAHPFRMQSDFQG